MPAACRIRFASGGRPMRFSFALHVLLPVAEHLYVGNGGMPCGWL